MTLDDSFDVVFQNFIRCALALSSGVIHSYMMQYLANTAFPPSVQLR